EAGSVRARAFERPGAPAAGAALDTPQGLAVAAPGGLDLERRARAAARRLDDDQGVGPCVRVDADDEVDLVCEHGCYLHFGVRGVVPVVTRRVAARLRGVTPPEAADGLLIKPAACPPGT